MPVYEYECQACKFYTEVMQKVTDTPLSRCPSCGKSSLKKLVSAPVFRLKGSGWYETDFKSDKENKRNILGAEKEETAAAKAEGAEGKPAADAKEAKPTEGKSAEPKAGALKAAAPKAAAQGATCCTSWTWRYCSCRPRIGRRSWWGSPCRAPARCWRSSWCF